MSKSHLYLSTGAPLAAVLEALLKIPPQLSKANANYLSLAVALGEHPLTNQCSANDWSSRLCREKYHKNSSLAVRFTASPRQEGCDCPPLPRR